MFEGTCSIEKLRDNCLTFARNEKYLDFLLDTDKRVSVIIPEKLDIEKPRYPSSVKFIRSSYVDYDFTKMHNKLYEDSEPDRDVFLYGAGVDPSVEIADGIHVAIGPDGKRMQLKHMGNVVCEVGGRIGPLSFIQRASLSGCSTRVKAGAMVDGYCTLGHNVVIGEGTAVAAGSVIGAGTVVGKNCLIGIHTIVTPHTKICDRVVIGIGSVVLKDITKPGIYFGVPAVFKKEHPEGWMW
jgi:UDP-3-O-[3-hydroxymyristoyl] glucosamine N-acyltransferase